MKITAMNIKEGMTIKVRGLLNESEIIKRRINKLNIELKESKNLSLKTKLEYFQYKLDNKIFTVERGTIKKSSPVLKVIGVNYYESETYKASQKKVTLKYIVLNTDKGNVSISDRQKVEVLNSPLN